MNLPRPPAFIYIGASAPHVAGIEAIRKSGIHTVVTDLNADAPGRLVADRFEVISARDVPAQLALAEDLCRNYEIIACYGISDYATPAIAEIYNRPRPELAGAAQRLCSIQRRLVTAIQKAADKAETKKSWRNAGLPVPREIWASQDANPEAHAPSVSELISGPAIVKPMDAYNSRGVTRLSDGNVASLQKALFSAREHGDGIVIEQYCEGPLLSVDGLMIDGRMHGVSITHRTTISNGNFQPRAGLRPAILPKGGDVELFDYAGRAALAIGFFDGPFTIDFILDPAGPVMLEITPKFHALLNEVIAENDWALKAWLAYLCGDESWRDLIKNDSRNAVGYVQLYAAKTGRLNAILGRETVERIPGFVEYYGLRNVGQQVRGLGSEFCDVCGVVWLKAANRQSLETAIERVRQTIIFETA
jgi:hypothetical protein